MTKTKTQKLGYIEIYEKGKNKRNEDKTNSKYQ